MSFLSGKECQMGTLSLSGDIDNGRELTSFADPDPLEHFVTEWEWNYATGTNLVRFSVSRST